MDYTSLSLSDIPELVVYSIPVEKKKYVEFLKTMNESEILPVSKLYEKCMKDFSKLKTLLKIKSDTEKRNLNTFFNEQFCFPKGSEIVRIPKVICKICNDGSLYNCI